MNWFSVFYWLTVADGVKRFFSITSDLFTVLAIIALVVYVVTVIGKACVISNNSIKPEDEAAHPDVRAWNIVRRYSMMLFYPFLVICLITWIGWVATPTKKDCLLIIAGGSVGNFLQSDSSARQLPADVTKFLHLSLKKEIEDLGADTKRELGLQTPKERLMDKVKDLSKEELIRYLQEDSTITIK